MTVIPSVNLQRVISAIAGALVIIIAAWYGGIPLLILLGIIIAFGLKEINAILYEMGLRPSVFLTYAGGLILLAGAYFCLEGYPGPAMLIILFLHLFAIIFLFPRYNINDMAGTLTGTLYVGLLSYLYMIRSLEEGWIWLILLLACTWANDTCAFLVGRAFGNKPLAPKISPNKTVEGSLGGILGSVVVAGAITLFYPALPLFKIMLLGLLLSIVAIFGDLLESALKRQAGIKDSGALIPGHGGILDRFDSTIFTAPLVYYYVVIFILS